MQHYILQGTQPVPVRDFLAWACWFESAERTVARTQVTATIEVSSVFLGLNHQWGNGPPLLFETMVFGLDKGDPLADYQWRYRTWHEAEQGHEAIVALVRAHLVDGTRA